MNPQYERYVREKATPKTKPVLNRLKGKKRQKGLISCSCGNKIRQFSHFKDAKCYKCNAILYNGRVLFRVSRNSMTLGHIAPVRLMNRLKMTAGR